jgi:predicted ArsR family transcriptional regulator
LKKLTKFGSTEQPTAAAILHFLKANGDSEIKAIAEFCKLTKMAVRRHLLKFREAGLVNIRTERRPQGRPAHLCSLTELGDAQFPRDYLGLACDLLSTLVVLDGEAKVKEVFRKRRRIMTAHWKPQVTGGNLEQRVCETAAILTECGYMAQVATSRQGGFVLTEQNCAIPEVAKCFPAACEEELYFIRDLVDAEVTRVSHRLAGDGQCCYVVRANPGGRRLRPRV